MANVYKFVDRCPEIHAAGILTKPHCGKIEDCLQHVPQQDAALLLQNEGTPKCEYPVPPREDNSYRRVHSDMRNLLTVPNDTVVNELNETVYSSHWNKPLGKSRDQTGGLPPCTMPEAVSHGVSTKPTTSAGAIVNPPKLRAEVILEGEVGRNLYRKTHNNFDPGEQLHRNYDSPNYKSCNVFGKPTPCFPEGKLIRNVLTWNKEPSGPSSERQVAFLQQTKPQLGKSLQPNQYVGACIHEDARFGFHPRDQTPLSEITQEVGGACPAKQEQLNYLKHINYLRCTLKKKEHGFPFKKLLDDFNQHDAGFTGQVPIATVEDMCRKYRIVINKPLLEKLMQVVGVMNSNGCVDYEKFVELIDWRCEFPVLPKICDEPDDKHYKTVYSLSMTNDGVNMTGLPPAGVPCARRDVPYPRSRTQLAADSINLEYETRMMVLLNPHIFAQYGLTHRDFFKPRTSGEMLKIFSSIGVALPGNKFAELWNEGCALDKTGGVCVETFRNLLDKHAANHLLSQM